MRLCGFDVEEEYVAFRRFGWTCEGGVERRYLVTKNIRGMPGHVAASPVGDFRGLNRGKSSYAR